MGVRSYFRWLKSECGVRMTDSIDGVFCSILDWVGIERFLHKAVFD